MLLSPILLLHNYFKAFYLFKRISSPSKCMFSNASKNFKLILSFLILHFLLNQKIISEFALKEVKTFDHLK